MAGLESRGEVGEAALVVCVSCGRENPAGFRFCGGCGAPLVEESAEVRKTVTIVFCDLVGSTALGERSDPEVLREVMGRYHATLRAVLERHGGRVEKFVGDAAMAVFGLPQLHEDDAVRAVRAALEMRAAVEQLGLEVRIGVNSGEVVAGSGETLVTGDAVNVAARLEQAAEAGDVLIGVGTERLVGGVVRVEAVEPLVLKGKSNPVPAFRVLGLLDEVPAYRRPLATPLVGRVRELDQLERSFATAVEERSPQLATVVGPPGIGKSRLARELVGRSQARLLVGRCLAYGEGITYWPLREIVGQIGDLRGTLAVAADGELAALRVEVAVGASEAVASSEEIAWGFRRLFEAAAAAEPLIVVFDDIHWAEPTLLDLIEYVVTFAREAPMFVLCTARPDLFESRPAWTTPKPNTTVVTLEPLGGTDAEHLVGALADLPQAARARIVEAAEGNPLFVEQLVAMQEDDGRVVDKVPPTLQALLAARIDGLAAPERAVAERGAVEGRLFHRGAVAELLPVGERADVGSHLLTLVRKDLIRPDQAFVPGDDGFRFGHGLIRDAAYEALPKRQRARLHEQYAQWLLEQLGDQAPDEIVGYHFEQAYQYLAELAALDATLGVTAATHLARAARAARARQDVTASLNLLGRAVDVLSDDAFRAALLVELGQGLMQAGEHARARETFEQAGSLATASGDERVERFARLQLAFLRVTQEPEGAADLALTEAEDAITAGEVEGDHELLAHAYALAAEAHLLRAQADRQSQAIGKAIEHAQAANDLPLELELLMRSAPPILFGAVPVADAMRHVDDIVERLAGVPAADAFARHVRGHLLARLGDFQGALQEMSEWRTHLRELGQETLYAITSGCVWDVCSWAGDWKRGEEALRDGYQLLEQMGRKAFLATVAGYLGESLYQQGKLDEADHYSVVSEQLGSSDDIVNEVLWRGVRAKVALARGDAVRAEMLAREAIAAAAGTDYLETTAAAWLDLAHVLTDRDEREAAAAAAQALALYEQKGNLVGAHRARVLLGNRSPAKGS